MGVEVAVASALVAGGTIHQIERGRSASRQQRRASKKEAEAREVSAAQQEHERQVAIRQQLRQERIRRAQVIAAAESAGVAGSSVEAGTIGAGQTLVAQGTAFATGASEAADVQTSLLQRGADLRGSAALDRAQGSIGGAFASLGTSAFSAGLV